MSFSNRAAAAMLDAFAGISGDFGLLGTAPGGAGGLYAALATVADSATGTFTEATGGGYARVQIPPASWADTGATQANPSVLVNDVAVTWPQATGDWSAGANMVAVVLCDAATAGNSVFVCALATAKPVLSGDTFSVGSGDLELTLT